MSRFASKSDSEIENWIANHEEKASTSSALYAELLEERARRAQLKQKLNMERSLEHLKQAAIEQRCTTYGDLAMASGVEWSQARHQMNGSHGHLDRLLDLCFLRNLPLLTAICVNQGGLAEGTLDPKALSGFVAAARRTGIKVTNEIDFHRRVKEECFLWGRQQPPKA